MTPDDPNRPPEQAGPEQPPRSQAMVPYAYPYPNDEIDLVEVGASLWRRWKLMAIVFFACVGAGLALAFIIPKSYNYTAVIRLGSYTKQDGTNAPVVSAHSAVAALNQGFIGLAVEQYAAGHDVEPRKIKIEAASGSQQPNIESDTVTLSGKAPQSLGPAYKAVESSASKALARSTQAQINVIRANIQHRLSKAKIQLANIQDPQSVKAHKAALRQKVISEQAGLENLKQQHSVMEDKLARLKDAEKLYKSQEQQLNSYLAKARKESLSSNNADSPSQAMTALLVNNQIQQNLQQLNDVEQKLTVSLPQQVASVQADLANNEQQQTVKKTAIERAQARLANYDSEHQRNIESQKATISNLQTRMDNVQATQLIVHPSRSVEPAGLPRSVIAILAAVLGVIFALLAAASANYAAAVRARLRAG